MHFILLFLISFKGLHCGIQRGQWQKQSLWQRKMSWSKRVNGWCPQKRAFKHLCRVLLCVPVNLELSTKPTFCGNIKTEKPQLSSVQIPFKITWYGDSLQPRCLRGSPFKLLKLQLNTFTVEGTPNDLHQPSCSTNLTVPSLILI